MSDVQTLLLLGPADAGRKLTTEEYESADFVGGYFYELAPGGILEVVRTPKPGPHLGVLEYLDAQFLQYRKACPAVIRAIANGSDAFVRVRDGGDRHPDRLIYTNPRPGPDADWNQWLPTLVVEVVSPGQKRRDYQVKREEYLDAGIAEYWIIDPEARQMLALCRQGRRWRERHLACGDAYEAAMLPGLRLEVADLFAAADEF